MSTAANGPRLGIALGGGSARGWAHIGVLSGLRDLGVEPSIVCGTSIGALVGGIYAVGRLVEFESWVGSLTRREVVGLLDPTMAGGGAIGGRKLAALFRKYIGDVAIEDLPVTFAAVATDLRTGSEVWLQKGPLLEAIRASISLPGMFTPVAANGRWLLDGGLVNPVPVSLCRALGAEVVIAVDLHGTTPRARAEESPAAHPEVVRDRAWWSALPGFRSRTAEAAGQDVEPVPTPPSVSSIVATSLDIMQARLSRSRLAGDPPDLLLSPHVQQVAPLDFSGGQPTIEEGYDVVRRMMPALADLLGLDDLRSRTRQPEDRDLRAEIRREGGAGGTGDSKHHPT